MSYFVRRRFVDLDLSNLVSVDTLEFRFPCEVADGEYTESAEWSCIYVSTERLMSNACSQLVNGSNVDR
jgi:hypothetical protein